MRQCLKETAGGTLQASLKEVASGEKADLKLSVCFDTAAESAVQFYDLPGSFSVLVFSHLGLQME